MPNRIEGDLIVEGYLVAEGLTVPSGSVRNDSVAPDAAIAAGKIEQQYAFSVELFGPATSITAITKLLHIARGAGKVIAFEAAIVTKATGADRTVTIDLKRSAAGAAFASVLTSTIVFDDESDQLVPSAAVVDTTKDDYDAGDLLEVTVAVAGVADAQALGLLVTLVVREEAD